MRRLPIASLAGLLLPVLFPAPLRASDTTYSETRAIPRQERASASGGTSETGNAGRDYASESESGEYADFSGDRISACINFDRIGSMEEAGGAVLMLPIALGACLAMGMRPPPWPTASPGIGDGCGEAAGRVIGRADQD